MATKKHSIKKESSKTTGQVAGPASGLIQWLPWIPGLLGVLLYLNTLTHDYALDDAIVITENMFTENGVSGIPGLLKYDTFFGFFKVEGKAQLVAGGRYRPLTPMMFAVERSLFGESPFAGHAMNALLYGLLCTLLFFTLRRLLQVRMGNESAGWIAFFAALLFAAHPLHTEAVANIKGRDEIVTLLGCLAAWWAVLRHVDARRGWELPLAAGALFLALLSKEHAITFLAVIPVSLWFFRPTYRITQVWKLWPLAVSVAAFLIIRGAVIGWQMGDSPMEMLNNPFIKLQGDRYVPFAVGERWGTILFTLLIYLKLLIWPIPLTHDYYPRHIAIYDLGEPMVWLSLVLHIGLVVLIIRGWKTRSLPAFAAFYYLATLSIMSNILFPVGTTMSERFLFMPSLAFVLFLAWVVEQCVGAGSRQGARYLLLGLIAAWGFLTVQRNPAWKDNFTLFLTDVKTSVNSAKLQNASGGELIAQAVKPENEAQRSKMLTEAVGHLEKAIAIHPGYKNACLLLGNAYNYLQDYDKSISWYQRALALDANYEEAINNMHITYRDAGRYYGEKQGDLKRSMTYLTRAEQMKPQDFETLRLLGIANGISGVHAEAIRYFKLALDQAPENAELMVYLGNAFMHSGNPAEANAWHDRARKTDPEVFTRLGMDKK